MDEEWRFHVDERIDALVAAGLSRDDAERRAKLEFGDPLRWKEQGREARGLHWLYETASDVQYALRQMRRAPAFTAVAIATLALGIGANTAIFSIVNGLLLRPLPVAEPDTLVTVTTANNPAESWTFGIWDEIRRRAMPFGGAFAFGRQRLDLSEGGETDPIDGIYASGDFFTVLRVPALLGRTFTAADDVTGGGPEGPVVVISHGFWQRRFAGEARVVGKRLLIQRVPVTIIGVTPRDFFGAEVGRTFDVALPLSAEPLIRGKDTMLDRERAVGFLTIMLRRRPGQSMEAAGATLRAQQAEIRAAAMPQWLPPDLKPKFLAEPFALVPGAAGTSALRAQYRRPVMIVFAVVAVVLLIGCANVVNLLLARANARTHEFAIRLALGAGRWRLARQLLIESLVLAVAGAALGVVLAAWGSDLLVAQLSTTESRVVLGVPLDRKVLGFTMAVALATTLVFGAAPALRGSRAAPMDAIKDRGRGAIVGRAGLSSGLVVAQVALSLMLVVAAGLFIRTLVRLSTLELGLDATRILIVNVDVTRSQTAPANRLAFFEQATEAVAAVPGVAQAAASLITPIGGGGAIDDVEVTGASPMAGGESPYGLPRFWNVNSSMVNFVTADWFATYGMTVRRGRSFGDEDTANAQPVAIVNEAFARKFLRGHEPLGALVTHRLGFGIMSGVTRTVVGVVNDAMYDSLRGGVRPVLFVPLAQFNLPSGRTTMPISVRSASESPGALSATVAKALVALDPNLAFSFRPLQDRVDATFVQERLLALVSGFFGGLALLLAAIGLYGVTAYGVSRQRGEIGVRLALGAQPSGVVRHVLGRVLILVAAGVIVGGIASLWLSRFVATLLFGLEPRDVTTLASAAAILTAIGAFAGWLPAYRASRIDPAEVLREN
jgi:predicted permease